MNDMLVLGIALIAPVLIVLGASIYYFIDIKRFNKYGIVTYGTILNYKLSKYDPNTKIQNFTDDLYVSFNLNGKECWGIIYTGLPFSKKKLEGNYAIGSQKKIIVLNKKDHYDVRLLNQNKKKLTYWQSILFLVLAIFFSLPSVFCISTAFYDYTTTINVNYNKDLNNPYIEKFATLKMNQETVESMNSIFNVQGRLENPNISKVNYIWEINDEIKIKGTINSSGKIRMVELEAPDDVFYDSNVKFSNDILTLKEKSKITYED